MKGSPGETPVLCKRSPSSSQFSGGNTDGSQTGRGCTVGWRGQDLYSSSVSWPLAEVLRVRKGHWVMGLGPTVQRFTKETEGQGIGRDQGQMQCYI